MNVRALLLVAVVAAGCAGGPEAREADDLLRRAEAADKKLTSVTYTLKVDVDSPEEDFVLNFDGGAYLKGKRAGEQFLRLRADAIPGVSPAGVMLFGFRDGQMTMAMGGQRQTFPYKEDAAREAAAWASLGSLDLDRCVKQVDVAPGRSMNGEAATRIAGSIDMNCLLDAFGKVTKTAEPLVPGGPPADFSVFKEYISDVDATLFVSERTDVLIGAVVTTTIGASGEQAELKLTYRLTSMNRPVRFPAGL